MSSILTSLSKLTRKRFIASLLLCTLCMLLGLGLSLLHSNGGAMAQGSGQDVTTSGTEDIGTIDPIPDRLQLGAELYLESCASCHVGVPPQTLPLQTWQVMLDDPEHYGVWIPPLVDPARLLIWNYVKHFSRSIREGEQLPYHLSESRYFKALHPRVEFEEDVTLRQCISCHPGVSGYNFRQLTADWDNAP